MVSLLCTILMLLTAVELRAAAPAILQLETDRQLERIRPREDALSFRILAHRPDGSPVSNARLKVHLQAPDTPWLASTDFPVVEGTSLFQTEIQMNRGEYAFRIVPPIRGVYTLNVSVSPQPGDESFAPAKGQWQTEISESPARQRNLRILLLVLVGVGGLSGFVFGRSPSASVLLLLLAATASPNPLMAHGNEHHAPPQPSSPPQMVSDASDRVVDLQLLTPKPRVGELASLKALYRDQEGALHAARFRLRVTQLEHGTEVFTTDIVANDGVLNWQGQFYDGSDHRVRVEAMPLAAEFNTGTPAQAELDVPVESVPPPSRSIIKSFGFLMVITALSLMFGIAVGRFFPMKMEA